MPTCLKCQSQFEITQDDLLFYDKISPIFNGKKYQISEPALCPECRQHRRLAFRNERNLYKRPCDLCKRNIISIFSRDAAFPVYCQKCWWSDKWNALDHGKNFDLNQSFFEQFAEVQNKVPKMAMLGANTENCDFCSLIADCRDCYLVFESSNNEDCLYGYWLQQCRDLVDCNYVDECELGYELENCRNCYGSGFLQNCRNCDNSWFLNSCAGCSYCAFCTNLSQKQYCLWNEQLKKEEYEKKMAELNFGSYKELSNLKTKFADFNKHQIKKYAQIENGENCIGDYIFNAKDCYRCFHANDAEGCRYGEHVWRGAKFCMDCSTAGRGAELIYESINAGIDDFNLQFCAQAWNGCHDFLYCQNCFSAGNSFGSIGLRHNQYCILNKQYSKEEYEQLVPQIIEQMRKEKSWGEFFPVNISPSVYNETAAQEYFPLEKGEVLKNGWQWRDLQIEIPKVEKIIPAGKLSILDDIKKVPDEILKWAIECAETKRPFVIQKLELEFYRKMNLPIPNLHPDIRHANRIKLRNPNRLWRRKCDSEGCDFVFESSYAPDRDEKVYCEACYLKKVY
ncbi:MAG: hypothetical protein NTZ80_02235 [Patescibacteria group bacterium]|nr:hypothetical protein [Patescibacteria group bacterium]